MKLSELGLFLRDVNSNCWFFIIPEEIRSIKQNKEGDKCEIRTKSADCITIDGSLNNLRLDFATLRRVRD